MARQKSIEFRGALGTYRTEGHIGEGGAGKVYAVRDDDDRPAALKILDPAKATPSQLKRFRNEYAFGFRNEHPNLLKVLDFGRADAGKDAPFYVMPRYAGSLRQLLRKRIERLAALEIFSRILLGVEAAHLLKVTHRDLKPENVLANGPTELVIADFGIARFEEEDLLTAVETKNGERLANFQYAAPEQRKRGGVVGNTADIFALGLMLNELFTGEIPQGTGYRTVAAVDASHSWVDEVVAKAIQFDPKDRPQTIAALRELLRFHSHQFESEQELSRLAKVVVPKSELNDPLVDEGPKIVGADYDGRFLILTLDKPVNDEWVQALLNMGSHTSAWNAGPERFTFRGNEARVSSDGENAQQIIGFFKTWMPLVTARYRQNKLRAESEEQQRRQDSLNRQKAELERQRRVRASLQF